MRDTDTFEGWVILERDPPELRGQWPGGWRVDEHGNLAFQQQAGCDEEPVWDCRACNHGILHSQAEHDLIILAAEKRMIRKAGESWAKQRSPMTAPSSRSGRGGWWAREPGGGHDRA